jgi:hypothetical protein
LPSVGGLVDYFEIESSLSEVVYGRFNPDHVFSYGERAYEDQCLEVKVGTDSEWVVTVKQCVFYC